MNLWNFFKDKCLLLILHIVCMGALAIFLKLTGNSSTNIILILIFWMIILSLWFFTQYLQRKKYFDEINQLLEKIDKRYLLGELLPDSFRLEDQLYKNMIHRSNKSVIEKIRQVEEARREYKEYIESWVHEVKAPITSISLLCENGRKFGSTVTAKDMLRIISMENQKIENYVDMVLYYAKSEEVYKDFFIQKTNLQEIVEEVLAKNRLVLIHNKVRAEVDCKDFVYTDKKWIMFILNQMVLNSVKYSSDSPLFLIYTKRQKDGVTFILEDNGVGIPAEELSRIFEKGFTGSNGRKFEKSTGMGLYLCQKLCDKLGIEVYAQSELGKGTKMLLEFPISTYIRRE